MTERVLVRDVFAAAVPDELESADMPTLVRELTELAWKYVARSYVSLPAAPRSLELGVIDFLITDDPDEVEKFQPDHDCPACRAGNDQAKAFLRDNPNRRIALANLAYTEVWP